MKIYEQNWRLHTGIEITQISWMRRAIEQKKCYSSLIIEAASPSIANVIIRSGLIVESKLKECKRYKSEIRLTQCFQCYHYGHIEKACNWVQLCGFCLKLYTTDRCSNKELEKNKCAVCRGNHSAWFRICRVCRAEIKKLSTIRCNLLDHYINNDNTLLQTLSSISARGKSFS